MFIFLFSHPGIVRTLLFSVIFSGQALWSVGPCFYWKTKTGRVWQKTHCHVLRCTTWKFIEASLRAERKQRSGTWERRERCGNFTRTQIILWSHKSYERHLNTILTKRHLTNLIQFSPVLNEWRHNVKNRFSVKFLQPIDIQYNVQQISIFGIFQYV